SALRSFVFWPPHPPPGLIVVPPGTKSVRVGVTLTLVFCAPVFGDTLVSLGAGPVIVKVLAALVPPLVITVTLRAPSVASDAMANVAVIAVRLLALMLLIVTPEPVMAIVVSPGKKLLPLKVTTTLLP